MPQHPQVRGFLLHILLHMIALLMTIENFLPLTTNVESRSYKEAVVHERWRNAMQKEMQALERNHTWDIVD